MSNPQVIHLRPRSSLPFVESRPSTPPREPAREIEVDILSDEDDTVETHQIPASEIGVPHDVAKALHLNRIVDYNTARSLNLAQLFDLLTEDATWKR